MKLVLILGIISTVSLSVFSALAATEDQTLTSAQEQEYKIKAKKRLYPGGRDEEPLKVQLQLPTVTRKMAPTTETPVEDNTPDEAHD